MFDALAFYRVMLAESVRCDYAFWASLRHHYGSRATNVRCYGDDMGKPMHPDVIAARKAYHDASEATSQAFHALMHATYPDLYRK